jgi:hypothetical protein
MASEIIKPSARVYTIRLEERPPALPLFNPDPLEEQDIIEPPPDPQDIPECLHQYLGVFDTRNCSQQATNKYAEHAIELLPDTKPPWQKLFPISPAELKALEQWLK